MSLLLAVLAAFLVARRAEVDAGTLLRHLSGPAHALAAGTAALELLARAGRIVFVARGLGLPVSLATALRSQLAGDALAAVTPSRLGSDPAKLTVLRGGGVGVGRAAAVLLGEMITEVIVLLALALVTLVLLPRLWWVSAGVGGYALVVSAGAGLALVGSRWSAGGAASGRLGRFLPERARHTVRRTAADFHDRAGRFARMRPKHALPALACALLHVGAKLAVLPALLFGSPIPGTSLIEVQLRAFFVLYATALLPPPGGGGSVEVLFATVLGGVLSPLRLAATLLWWRFYTFYLTAAVGWLYVVGTKTPRPRMLDTSPSPAP